MFLSNVTAFATCVRLRDKMNWVLQIKKGQISCFRQFRWFTLLVDSITMKTEGYRIITQCVSVYWMHLHRLFSKSLFVFQKKTITEVTNLAMAHNNVFIIVLLFLCSKFAFLYSFPLLPAHKTHTWRWSYTGTWNHKLFAQRKFNWQMCCCCCMAWNADVCLLFSLQDLAVALTGMFDKTKTHTQLWNSIFID